MVVPTAEEVSKTFDFTGKTALVTGANTGIGKETARVLALRNAHVIMACRSVEKGEEARQDILKSIGQGKAPLLEVVELDLSSLVKVREFAERFARRKSTQLHYLINNAGVMLTERKQTKEGFEMHFGVNHLAHFLLTLLLLPYLKASQPARVVVVSSDAHYNATDLDLKDVNLTRYGPNDYPANLAYGLSKLYNILFATALGEVLKGTGVTSNSLHPGMIQTELGRDLDPKAYNDLIENLSKSFDVPILFVEQGAATTLYALGCPEGGTQSGLYFSECKVGKTSKKAKNPELMKELWSLSEKLANVKAKL